MKQLNEHDCVQHYPTSTVTDLLMNLESSRKVECSPVYIQHQSQGLQSVGGDGDIDPKSLYYGAIYEVEVWLKYSGAKGTVRRKLDLVAKCHPKKDKGQKRASIEAGGGSEMVQQQASELELEDEVGLSQQTTTSLPLSASQERLFEADRDYIAHDTVVQDMCAYLRKKGVNNPEEMLSLPVR